MSTLNHFLSGAPVRAATRRKLFRWLMESDLQADERSVQCIRMMKEVAADLPERAQLGAVQGMLESLRQQFLSGTRPVPLWLHRVMGRVEEYRREEAAPPTSKPRDASGSG